MSLPTFKYHPDSIKTGSVKPSDTECECCNEKRGYIYTGPVYSVEELIDCICPWCIADGSAHAKFEAEFTDSAGVGGYSNLPPLQNAIIEEVAFRTPGFSGWQQERWLACCSDAAAFVGIAGFVELERQWSDAIPSIRDDADIMDEAKWQDYLHALDKDGGPTAYIFRCLHCNKHLGYSDCH